MLGFNFQTTKTELSYGICLNGDTWFCPVEIICNNIKFSQIKVHVEASEVVVVKFTESTKIKAVYENCFCFPTQRLPSKSFSASIERKIVFLDKVY